jgi:DNA polymerase-1
MTTKPTELPPPGSPDVLYLVDLSGYVFRAYHALPPLTSPTGEPTHAVYGTVGMLTKLVEERKPALLGVAMDSPGKTFRDELDATYKAHRPPPPPDLSQQMERCRQIVEAYKIPIFIGDGYEADDFIAVAVGKAKERGLRVVIASSDKDLMQLVDDGRVMLWDAMRDKVFGPPEVQAKFGVPPEQVRDLLALVGDAVDNVPGVPTVGAKTAADLLAQFGSVDAIYQRLDEVKKPRTRDALRDNEAAARLSQKLVTLYTDLPIEMDLDALRYAGADGEKLRALFTELGFHRFLKAVHAPVTVTSAYTTILARADLEAFAATARDKGRLAVELHATSREPMRASLVGVALSCEPGHAAYVPVGHRYLGAPAQLSVADVRAALGPLLEDASFPKTGHDTKFATVLGARLGLPIRGARFDTMLATYLLDPEADNDLGACAEREVSAKLAPLDTGGPKKRGAPQRGLDDVEVNEAAKWAGQHADYALRLQDAYTPRLEKGELGKLLTDVELPLSRILAEMERVGVLVDLGTLETIGREMATELASIEARAKEAVGHEVNLASPKQLEALLYDELGLKAGRKTKTGRSTDADALEALVGEHPLPGLVLEHRAIAKLKGTYVDALPKLVNPDTGRIHGHWDQAVAATGRISSNDPNLQNIPIRTALGRSIRRAFVAPPGMVLLAADYSQIELRVLAHLSKDPVLVDAFRTGQDVHVRTAMEIFGVPADGVTDEMRRRSKTINFGVIYGMGEVALAKRLSIPRAEAAKFIAAYFERYVGVREFLDRTMEEARTTEQTRTLFGRVRHLPDLRSSDAFRRSYAERIAQNTPIQGTAADLLKMAMLRFAEPVVPGARMVLTVHDELAFEVPADHAAEATAKVKRAMETVAELDVPLVVDAGTGASWADVE